jgi:uncharacterized YceG family protein
VLVRRLVALTLLVLALGALGFLAVAAVGGGGDDEASAPTTTLLTRTDLRPVTVTRATSTGRITTVIFVPKPLRILFPEGFTRRQMAQRVSVVDAIARRKRHVKPALSAKQYLRLTGRTKLPPGFQGPTGANLEGFLFPATYDFEPKTTTAELVKQQLDAFRANWRKVDLAYAKSRNLTPYDVLIIASMVEAETLSPDERQLVSAVIYNRLRQGIPLGIDATIRYGLNIPPTESLHQSQLHADNPYNTRDRQGLPPTPISNPGLASIQAAAHPAKVDYLYFVRKPDKKHHFFTASFQEFQDYARAHGFGAP